jgi:tetratricopeptide (TPR) repeat protein
MSTIKKMLEMCGSIENAEKFARNLINKYGNEFLLDLQLILSTLGEFEESWEVCQKAMNYNPDDIRPIFNSGLYYLKNGNLLEGLTRLNKGRLIDIWGNNKIPTIKPLWNGQNLKNKTLLFYSEAGFGDEIIFSRFVKYFQDIGSKVIISCDKGLAPIFSRMDSISSAITKEAISYIHYDYWVPSMLAPVSLRIEYKDLINQPYLTPNTVYIKKFKNIIKNDKFKVGIRWLGREGDDYITRIFPENLLFDVVKNNKISVYSLQKDLKDRNNILPDWIIDLEPYLNCWEDTLAAIDNLDLVISSCTSLAHLSAAMGKSTWVVIPIAPYFIWSHPEEITSPWYDSVRLFRQKKYDSWIEPFNQVKEELEKII